MPRRQLAMEALAAAWRPALEARADELQQMAAVLQAAATRRELPDLATVPPEVRASRPCCSSAHCAKEPGRAQPLPAPHALTPH